MALGFAQDGAQPHHRGIFIKIDVSLFFYMNIHRPNSNESRRRNSFSVHAILFPEEDAERSFPIARLYACLDFCSKGELKDRGKRLIELEDSDSPLSQPASKQCLELTRGGSSTPRKTSFWSSFLEYPQSTIACNSEESKDLLRCIFDFRIFEKLDDVRRLFVSALDSVSVSSKYL